MLAGVQVDAAWHSEKGKRPVELRRAFALILPVRALYWGLVNGARGFRADAFLLRFRLWHNGWGHGFL